MTYAILSAWFYLNFGGGVKYGLGSAEAAPIDLQTVDVDSLELTRPRTVGVEQLGLWAMQR